MLDTLKAYFAMDTEEVVSARFPESCGAILIFASKDNALKFAKNEEGVMEVELPSNEVRKAIMEVARRVVFKNGRAAFVNPKAVLKVLQEPTTTIDDFQTA